MQPKGETVASVDEFARQQAILLEIDSSGSVTVKDLSGRFSVSTVTIRKDLESLERRSMLRRVRGGAVAAGTADEGAFEMRIRYSREAKEAIARQAEPLVRSGDVIALDASTTCFYLAQELLDLRNLVVITNGMRTATLFMEQSNAMVLMPGGVLRRSAGSMVGPIGDVLAGRGRIDRGFFGVKGISVDHGMMENSIEEADAKRYLATACDEIYGLFDSSKVGRFGLHSFAPTEKITGMFTDEGIGPDVVSEWALAGVPIHTVDVSTAPGSAR
ncbi:DeoR/GlpR transcriptional regulator [Nakamurella silvestris]|nr:DeoR/GlpR transcriptional regulator [Nakamurella silvestris]